GIVLAVGIVVSLLRTGKLVARQEHGRSLGEEKRSQEISHLPQPQGQDIRIGGLALHPAVPTVIVIGAIAVVLKIRLVMLGVVADQVMECESIVTGDEVDAGAGAASVVQVKVA